MFSSKNKKGVIDLVVIGIGVSVGILLASLYTADDIIKGETQIIENPLIELIVEPLTQTFLSGFSYLLGDIWGFILYNILVPIIIILWIALFFYIQYWIIRGYIFLYQIIFPKVKTILNLLIQIPIFKKELNKLFKIFELFNLAPQSKRGLENDA